MGATSNLGSEQRTLGHSESSLSVMCEVTGGRAVAVTGMRALLQNMEGLVGNMQVCSPPFYQLHTPAAES